MSAAVPSVARPAASPRFAAGLALLALLVALVFRRVAVELWHTWNTNENYSHGPLVLVTSAALVWLRWSRLAEVAPRPDGRGLALLAFGCGMHVLGVRNDLFALQSWSLIPVLFGLSLTFLGGTLTRRLAFPIAYLGFMMTFPPILMNQLSYALKEIAVRLAARGAETLGVAMQRDGMTLYLQTGRLTIENPCSGLRSLIALVATGTLFAYLQPGRAWRRAAMWIAAVPIAILGNAARLLVLIVAAHYRSVTWATGAFHDVTGYVLYAVALGLMLLLRGLLTPRHAPAAPPAPEVAA